MFFPSPFPLPSGERIEVRGPLVKKLRLKIKKIFKKTEEVETLWGMQ
jgi:hypothetical protein